MHDGPGQSKFNLEARTFDFARNVRTLVKTLPRTICNIEGVRQLVRSSGSGGANSIGANDSRGSKDLRMRLRIARKEAKESRYWLRLLDPRQESNWKAGAKC